MAKGNSGGTVTNSKNRDNPQQYFTKNNKIMRNIVQRLSKARELEW